MATSLETIKGELLDLFNRSQNDMSIEEEAERWAAIIQNAIRSADIPSGIPVLVSTGTGAGETTEVAHPV